jgi:hypothetical protein
MCRGRTNRISERRRTYEGELVAASGVGQSRRFAHVVSAAALPQRPDPPAEDGRFRIGPKHLIASRTLLVAHPEFGGFVTPPGYSG